MEPTPRVSVLVLNYNGKHLLRECLDSVLAQSYPDIEVVLVDNGSADGSCEFLAAEYPTVKRIRSDTNLGFTGGNNLGAAHCTGEFVYFLNNDVRADRDAVASLMRARKENPDYTVFGSLLLNYDDPGLVDSAGDTFYWMGWGFAYYGYPAALFERPRPIASAKGAAVLYPKALLDRLGWFDPDFFLYFEDIDLSFRARHLGAKILLVPASRIYHKGFASSEGGQLSPLSFYYSSRNYQLAVLKTFPWPVLVRFFPGFVFAKLTQAIAAYRSGCLMACVKGNLSSLRLLPRILSRRRAILRGSRVSSREFGSYFRKRMFSETLFGKGPKIVES